MSHNASDYKAYYEKALSNLRNRYHEKLDIIAKNDQLSNRIASPSRHTKTRSAMSIPMRKIFLLRKLSDSKQHIDIISTPQPKTSRKCLTTIKKSSYQTFWVCLLYTSPSPRDS